MNVLFVCTRNLCRSPMAAAWLDFHARRLGESIHTTSAGTAEGGMAPPRAVLGVMAEHGFDLTEHRSRALELDDLRSADLVVGLGREHVRAVAVLDRCALGKAFTLKELVRRADRAPRVAGEPLGGWLARVGAGRRPSHLLGWAPADDVEDPSARLADVRRTSRDLDRLTQHLARLCSSRNRCID